MNLSYESFVPVPGRWQKGWQPSWTERGLAQLWSAFPYVPCYACSYFHVRPFRDASAPSGLCKGREWVMIPPSFKNITTDTGTCVFVFWSPPRAAEETQAYVLVPRRGESEPRHPAVA